MVTIPFVSPEDQEWANAQIEAIAPNQEAIRAFDDSEDGARFLAIASMTMWENLGANSLPATAETDGTITRTDPTHSPARTTNT